MTIRDVSSQRTLGAEIEFAGIGVHSGEPGVLTISPAPADSGYLIRRDLGGGLMTDPVQVHFSRVTRTTLCTTIDLGNSHSVATIEHAISALSGMGIDNALLTITCNEFPILDGSAAPYVEEIAKVGIQAQAAPRKYLKVLRPITVRNKDAYATLEPFNGRQWDLEIDFDNQVIGQQRMIFEWTPRKYAEHVAAARTFGFAREAKVLRQAGYARGASLDNAISVDEDRVLNPGGLRFNDEFVRHKLLDAVGDLALGGHPIFGLFRSYKGGHALNALVLKSLLENEANYETVTANDLPLDMDSPLDLPRGTDLRPHLKVVG